jgi:2'-5' RNA ligase
MTRYLAEVRLGNEKAHFRGIIHDVRERFRLLSSKRPVPHVTLFGPYDTNQGYKVKRRTQDVLSNYRLVPYRVTGFDCFQDAGVVYADVEPSDELRRLRADLVDALKPVTSDHRPWDFESRYDYHITIAMNIQSKQSRVLDYLRREYQMDMRFYAKRITALDNREMMWEWDVPRRTELSSEEATSRASWRKTTIKLNELSGGGSENGGASSPVGAVSSFRQIVGRLFRK